MELPFTRDAFLDVFAAYNVGLWPFVAALWLLTAIAFLSLLHSPHRRRFITTVLAVHWAWAAVAYHLAFFTRINSAAWGFGALFLLQAALFTRHAISARGLRFPLDRRPATFVPAAILIGYTFVYPAIARIGGDTFPRLPTFGVPCPTTSLTIGFLLAAERPLPIALAVIPILWSIVGGSAAMLLDVYADFMLLAAGAALALALVGARRHSLPAATAPPAV